MVIYLDAVNIENKPESKSPTLALLALIIGAFAIGMTEFIIMGLLPEVAKSLQVSIPSAGLLITGYALGVAIGAPIITVATHRMKRGIFSVRTGNGYSHVGNLGVIECQEGIGTNIASL